jgi:formylglycine-generating enzyme required for sulfatase activity
VDWHDAQSYVAWLNRMTGTDSYRLLSQAEWEYAARGVTSAQDCGGCGSQWDDKQTAPVGSFKENEFGLYDMHGNVQQWVEDCYAAKLDDAPSDGTAWKEPCTDETLARSFHRGILDHWRGNVSLCDF